MIVSDRNPVARRVLAGYSALSLLVVVLFTADPDRSWGTIALALAMPVLATYLVLAAPRTRRRDWTLVALAFSWFGDALGVDFLIKLGFFLIAQIAYVVTFWPHRSGVARRRVLAFAYAAGIATTLVVLARDAGSLLVHVVAYGITLGLMAVLAWGVDWRCGVGALLFLVSDVVLALAEFVVPDGLTYVAAINAIVYLPGQALIVLGVARRPSPARGVSSASAG